MAERVFISYEHGDRGFVSRLVDILKREAVPIWWDQDIKLGTSIVGSIEEALLQTSVFLVVLSRRTAASRWVPREVSAALHRNGELRVIPILRPGHEIPAFLRDYEGLAFLRWSDAQAKALAARLRDLLGITAQGQVDLVKFWRSHYESGRSPERKSAVDILFNMGSCESVTALLGDIELQPNETKRVVAKRMSYYVTPTLLSHYNRLAASLDSELAPNALLCLVLLGYRQKLAELVAHAASKNARLRRNALRQFPKIPDIDKQELQRILRVIRQALDDLDPEIKLTSIDTIMKLAPLIAKSRSSMHSVQYAVRRAMEDPNPATSQMAETAFLYLSQFPQ